MPARRRHGTARHRIQPRRSGHDLAVDPRFSSTPCRRRTLPSRHRAVALRRPLQHRCRPRHCPPGCRSPSPRQHQTAAPGREVHLAPVLRATPLFTAMSASGSNRPTTFCNAGTAWPQHALLSPAHRPTPPAFDAHRPPRYSAGQSHLDLGPIRSCGCAGSCRAGSRRRAVRGSLLSH